MHLRKIALLLLAALPFFSAAQPQVDSLKKLVAASTDTAKMNALLALADKYKLSDTVNSFPHYREAIALAAKLDHKRGLTLAYTKQARKLGQISNDTVALAHLDGLLRYIDTTKANNHYGDYLITKGSIRSDAGDFVGGVTAYLQALDVFTATKNARGLARANHGLGFANQRMRNDQQAEKYFVAALKYYKQLNDYSNSANITGNLGGIMVNKAILTGKEADYTRALAYFGEAATMAEKAKDDIALSTIYHNTGSLYGSRKEYEPSRDYYEKAAELRRKAGYQAGLAITLCNLSMAYAHLGQIDKAEAAVNEAYPIAVTIHAPHIVLQCYQAFSVVYEGKKNFEEALKYHQKYSLLSDSLLRADKNNMLTELEERYKNEKQAQQIKLLNEAQLAKDEVIAKQKLVNYVIAAGLAIILLLSVFIYKGYAAKKKANLLLQDQNAIIQEKNKSITDSISYAGKIQSAVLISETELRAQFGESFLLFLPRDIVSGDFYWTAKKDHLHFLAVADCTGHGVPGGFMSMLGMALLNELVNERELKSPAGILDTLREMIIASLRQTGQAGETRDGMDIILCVIDTREMQLRYAAANNELCLVRDHALIECKADRMPVGYHHVMTPFTEHSIQLQKGDQLFAFSDGYADQFGGREGKKFKRRQLLELLVSLSEKTPDEQKRALEQAFTNWKGALEQIDDVCVVGVRI